MSFTIEQTNLDICREPLTRPFGFKGGAFTEKWLTHVTLTNDVGVSASAMGGLAVLWSDPRVFLEHSEVGGNMIMASLLDHALGLVRGRRFETPLDLIDEVLASTYAYGQRVVGYDDLRPTFALNALVALDNAAWLLHAADLGATSFDDMIPEAYRGILEQRHEKVARVPLLSYQVQPPEIIKLVEAGHFFLKIKLGAAGDPDEMLAKDMRRLEQVHQAVGARSTPHAADGRIRYYLDANGRYPDRDTLARLLDHAQRLGMHEQIALVEEPLAEGHEDSLAGLGVMIAADESLHDPADVADRAALGYGAVALKPAGKTLSVTLKMAREAQRHGLGCLVADSACTPRLVDWNRNVASRIAPLPGMNMGLMESNGAQNYRNWQAMLDQHPCAGAPWLTPREGVFELGEEYFRSGGGIFEPGATP